MQAHDPRALASFDAFWVHYLLHHRRAATRRLHFAGSVICIVGFAASLSLASVWPVVLGLALGYFCAFAGHWWAEGNRPLTFEHPLRAGLCNWRLFGVECAAMFGLGGGFDATLERGVRRRPEVLGWMCDAGGQ
ncbi:MAG: DUF962 domain-containing protein [Deltaproteobacteria bacterium]|jgi:hypothetical protein|nr:DUF962 domain-containing protein [Deltaproteobacteria bacterium]